MSLEREIENQIIKVFEDPESDFDKGVNDCISNEPRRSEAPDYVRGYEYQKLLETQVRGVVRYE